MSIKKKYVDMMVKSVDHEFMVDRTAKKTTPPYYNDKYYRVLKGELQRHHLVDSFSLELKKTVSNLYKMCAVASSSRIGFLYGIQNDINVFERTDIKNGVCKPHYDAYHEIVDNKSGAIKKEFLEFKCQEFTEARKSHCCIVAGRDRYNELIKKYWGNAYDSDKENLYEAFGIEECKYFDFKQLICHLLGLLSLPYDECPVNLKYVMFIPKMNFIDSDPEIKEWYGKLKEKIEGIFNSMMNMEVTVEGGKKAKLSSLVNIDIEYFEVAKVNDFVYSNVR